MGHLQKSWHDSGAYFKSNQQLSIDSTTAQGLQELIIFSPGKGQMKNLTWKM